MTHAVMQLRNIRSIDVPNLEGPEMGLDEPLHRPSILSLGGLLATMCNMLCQKPLRKRCDGRRAAMCLSLVAPVDGHQELPGVLPGLVWGHRAHSTEGGPFCAAADAILDDIGPDTGRHHSDTEARQLLVPD